MTFARPLMHLAWLAVAAAALASYAGQTSPRLRGSLSPSGPIHILTER